MIPPFTTLAALAQSYYRLSFASNYGVAYGACGNTRNNGLKLQPIIVAVPMN